MPENCPPGTNAYVIRAGDTFYQLANRFGTTVSALVSANPTVNPDRLHIGQNICIPGQPQSPPCPERNFYTVQSGDTLYQIAKRYHVPLADLIAANPGIDPDNLRIGQVICIPLAISPVNCPPGTSSYMVQQGETYYSLAIRFNTTVEQLRIANPGVNPDALLIGQTICIPLQQKIYSNRDYKVVFLYPGNWIQINPERVEGADGFFQVSAAGGDTLDEICSNEAHHVLNPYGTHPSISRTSVQGQEACLILPSEDQPVDMKNQAALIVRYPQPIMLNSQLYNFFVLWADQPHIQEMAATLEFL